MPSMLVPNHDQLVTTLPKGGFRPGLVEFLGDSARFPRDSSAPARTQPYRPSA